MSQLYIHDLCVGHVHCYAWIWTSVYNSHGGLQLSLCLHASANLDTYILNLHTQARATVCTLHGNMYMCTVQVCVHSWCLFHGTFKYCYFFEQVCSTKMAIKLAFREFNDENECEACNQGYILQFSSLKLELWFRSYDILNETRHILSKYSRAYMHSKRTQLRFKKKHSI